MKSRAETELIVLAVAYGMKQSTVEELIDEIKQDAVEADNAYENEVNNLRNAVEDAVHGVEAVLTNLRNA
ncbi:hypothetical protein SEA_DAUBENSKI_35 [Streptomyces phage Daubenski]|uniref:Uncharacterized protein n=1 Tax=Streptomyces phage Daubenski TaxID=2653725 RepID=A0A5Q2WIK3_9CAUD|nr:hypothetical protein KNU80_gp035 [Streptomyces phage Daubenski]QGH76345.1 hypothetical protein SEA_DAUBENSKI_35 [Streptomyces phage Daubenski]